jgi:hypothetical protein
LTVQEEERVNKPADVAGLTVVSMAVGHGDATLLIWRPINGRPTTVLIDGGPKTGTAKLAKGLSDAGVDRLDIVVLTHCDADHVDGLVQLWGDPSTGPEVGEYWGPCVPAFERLAWLFPARISRGLVQSGRMEHVFGGKGVQIVYPLEHHTWHSPDRGLTIRVLSPASRLIKRLLLAADAEDLFLDYPTPLGWLLEPEEPATEDAFGALRGLLDRQTFLTPADVQNIPPAPAGRGDQDAKKRSWAEKSGQDPEFFGNNVLNDTSIVLLVEARCENTTRRLLFTGDIENFCYLAGRHPIGLQADIVKAPHHGSRSFLGRDMALEEVWQWLRPRAIMVSANGKHGLPRTDFRNAALRWGATLFCTCRRSREIVTGAQPAGSCNEAFACRHQENVVLDISATGISSTGIACASGALPGIQPLIQIKQHVVEPSNILARFTENELLGHVEWLRKRLAAHHQQRLAAPANIKAQPVAVETLIDDAVAEGRHPAAFNIDLVLDRGAADNRFWVSQRKYSSDRRFAYALPGDKEIRGLESWLAGFSLVQVVIDTKQWSGATTVSELAAAADTEFLAAQVATRTHLPAAMFRPALWPRLAEWLCKHRSASVRFVGSFEKTPVLLFYPAADQREAAAKLFDQIPRRQGREMFGTESYSSTDWFGNIEKIPTSISDLLMFPWLNGGNVDAPGMRDAWKTDMYFKRLLETFGNDVLKHYIAYIEEKDPDRKSELRAQLILAYWPFAGAQQISTR